MRAFLIVLACLLAACNTMPRVQAVNVPYAISTPCKAAVPDVPAWPTEIMKLDPKAADFLDRFIAAATAEIELRIGYEARLLAELKSCL